MGTDNKQNGHFKIIEHNKRAYFEYFIEDTFEAGIALVGTEIKSVRQGGASLKESFCRVEKGEVFLKNCHIAPFEKKNAFELYDARRDRKLLLNKQEIRKIIEQTTIKGCALIATKMYLKGNRVKVEIGIAKGKKLYDKRADLKEKDIKRDLDRY